MSNILDSGNRREFESGAVRDIDAGKGRMELRYTRKDRNYYKGLNMEHRERMDSGE